MADPAEDQGQSAQLRIEWHPDAEPPAPLYSNYVQGSFTPEDFSLLFGWYAPPLVPEMSPEGVITTHVQPVARVVVPLNLMPNVIALLQRQVDAYEHSFGKIPEHPNRPDWLKQKDAE